MKKYQILLMIMTTVGFLPSVFAGTIITANLPADMAIINISATQDGSVSCNGDQSLWYQPFNTGGTLLEYTIQPGTYSFRVINPADAAQMFPSLTTGETNEIYTGWTFNSPWTTDYLVFDSTATNNNSIPQLFDGAFSNTNGSAAGWQFFGNPTDAYNAAISQGFYNLLRTAASGGRDSTNNITAYAFVSTTTLIFAVPDYALGDNAGGVSVLVSQASAVPRLSITSSAGTVNLQWPTNAAGFTLSQTTNLQPAAWTDVASLRTVTNFNYSVTLPIDPTTNRFFRLHNP
jgi:hypothetical protein